MTLDNKLDFKSHIREAILKARRGIGMIKYLSKYISREVLDQVYKLYTRSHLDYGDIIYHKFDPNMHLQFTKKLEQVKFLIPGTCTSHARIGKLAERIGKLAES